MLTRFAVSLVLLMCFASSLVAQIDVKATYAPHEPIFLRAGFPTTPNGKLLWKISKPAVLVFANDSMGKPDTSVGYVWAAPGKYDVDLTYISIDWESKSWDLQQHSASFTVGGVSPTPTPTPGPTPDPTPTPQDPAPIPLPGFRVMMIYESAEPLPPKQYAILMSRASGSVREFLDAKCVKEGQHSSPGYRIIDKDQPMANDLPHWAAVVKRPRTSIPWLIVSNGTTGYEGPLPEDSATTLTILKKYAGT